MITEQSNDHLAAPEITRVVGADNVPIPNNGTTHPTQVTISGAGTLARVVTVTDNGNFIGSASITIAGTWAIPLAVTLALGRHEFIALVNEDGSSLPWVIIVTVAAQPPAPDVLEDSAANVLDLRGLVRITVRVPDYGMQLNDTVMVRWQGTAQHDTSSKPINVIAPLDFDIPLQWAQEDINKSVSITYSYGRGANPVEISEALLITVVNSAPALDLIRPQVVEATGPDRDQLNFSSLADGADVHVSVNYTGMDLGQTVRVRWLGRVEYLSDVKTVTTIAPLQFTVWRDEVIDSIGRLVDVNYSVVETPGGPLLPSRILSLNVLPQALNLVPPTINGSRSIVYVAYAGSLTSHTIVVRWRGIRDRATEVQRPPSNGGTTQFAIPSSWVDENQGRTVLVNYSVGVGSNPLMFSQLLRLPVS